MSNGLAKVLNTPAREVDLLSDFYNAWKDFHKRVNELAKASPEEKREELQGLSQNMVECSVAIEYYRNRHNMGKNGRQ